MGQVLPMSLLYPPFEHTPSGEKSFPESLRQPHPVLSPLQLARLMRVWKEGSILKLAALKASPLSPVSMRSQEAHTAPGTQQTGSFLWDTSSRQSRGCLEQSGAEGLECRQRSWGTPSCPSDARRNLNHGLLTWLPLHSTASHLP